MHELTDKQRRFCEEYVIDRNATRAATAAGYSPNSAMEQGYQLLQKEVISDHIEKIRDDLQTLAKVSALRNLLELKKMAYSSFSDILLNWDTLKDFEDLPRGN